MNNRENPHFNIVNVLFNKYVAIYPHALANMCLKYKIIISVNAKVRLSLSSFIIKIIPLVYFFFTCIQWRNILL